MRVVRSHPTAGQATLEYIAAVALLAALLGVAAPAVGAPDVGRAVVGAVKHGICVAGGDVCTNGDARREGLAPCPLRSDTSGAEGSVTAFSVEVGGKWTLTVTPRSDGSVTVVRTAGGSAGVAGGVGPEFSLGPVEGSAGVNAAARIRVQDARGWTFPDQATARRFLAHAVRNGLDGQRWPWSWQSSEKAEELAGFGGVSAGGSGYRDRLDAIGVAVSLQSAIGARETRDGLHTIYTRIALDGPEISVPFRASPYGRGHDEWVAEYTSGSDGPREIAFRQATAGDAGRTVTETVARLDLRDPANLAIARPLFESKQRWTAVGGAGKQAVMDRIATHGVVERTVSAIDDDSAGASFGVSGGWKFALGGKKVAVHKRLVRATVQRGALAGARLDCVR
jgi:hypothetical protein